MTQMSLKERGLIKQSKFKTNEVPEPKFGVEPHTVKELPALPVGDVNKTTCFYINKFKITC